MFFEFIRLFAIMCLVLLVISFLIVVPAQLQRIAKALEVLSVLVLDPALAKRFIEFMKERDDSEDN